MLILDFLLAFAILMVAFSTVVSGLVEVLTRLLNLRSRNLRNSLDGYLENVLWPNLIEATGAKDEALSRKATLAELRDHLTRNLAVPDGLSRRSGPIETLAKLFSRPWIETLSPEAMVQRLAETDVGQAIRTGIVETSQDRFDALLLGFDRYMALSSERFRRNSNLMVFLVSIAFAFGAQVHFTRLVQGLESNPATIEALIASQDQILAGYVAAQEGDIALEVELEDGTVQSHLDAAKAALAASVEDLKTLRAKYQLPIGARLGEGADCAPVSGKAERLSCHMGNVGAWVLWQMNVLLSGVLIGLGGPFWYRVTKQLSQARIFGGNLSDGQAETVAGQAGGAGQSVLTRNQTLRSLFRIAGTNPVLRVMSRPEGDAAPA
ncbi:hypothetical protein SAMN06297129_0559 [Pseudooceanicola antarcticus]|uniref:Uncharacterized protein n=1 Tax=Pseudooceanicola antarcticus TaxID=1247613 RepID=A0A285HU90_9RHOB|nr:hypothetical protein [Pseudooceanicola antarcticus]PJE27506.1 hypothetical protein CVM39_13010 [Pseudooceanicola antarcticus]SNY39270.1 hypothetical protein SAMN06297129_0559 [Pseudooceanicola antarcticus]